MTSETNEYNQETNSINSKKAKSRILKNYYSDQYLLETQAL